jgi:hypothetical protein
MQDGLKKKRRRAGLYSLPDFMGDRRGIDASLYCCKLA